MYFCEVYPTYTGYYLDLWVDTNVRCAKKKKISWVDDKFILSLIPGWWQLLCMIHCISQMLKSDEDEVRALPAWGSSFAGRGFDFCRQGGRVLPAKRDPHDGKTRTPLGTFWKNTFFSLSAIFEHSGPWKLYQTSSLSVTRHMKRINIFHERSL